MITISRAQQLALEAAALDAYADRLAAEARAEDATLATKTEAELRARVDDRIARARAAGVTRESAVTRYVKSTVATEAAPPPPDPPAADDAAGKPAGGASQPCPSFIEVNVKDDAGAVVPNQRFVIELPDGSKKEGVTDGNGRVYLANVDAGDCHVSLPDVDLSD